MARAPPRGWQIFWLSRSARGKDHRGNRHDALGLAAAHLAPGKQPERLHIQPLRGAGISRPRHRRRSDQASRSLAPGTWNQLRDLARIPKGTASLSEARMGPYLGDG